MKAHYYKIYDNIKRLRELKGDKQETVARALGISQSAYSRLENGESDLSITQLVKLCMHYRVGLQEFITWDGQKDMLTQSS